MSEKNEWKLVPVEPTPEMRKAAADAWLDCGSKLFLNKAASAARAAIAAAPAPAPSAPGDAQDERQAFEAWAEDQGFVLDCDFFEVSGQYYDSDDTQLAYDIWRAARASAPAAGDALEWQGLTKAELASYVGAIIEYGTEFVAPLYSVVESIEKRLREKNTASQQQEW